MWCPHSDLPLVSELFPDCQRLATCCWLLPGNFGLFRFCHVSSGLEDDGARLRDSRNGATAYAEAVAVYCTLAVSKLTDYNSGLVVWSPTRDQAKSTFARQALPMVWGFAEVNPLARAAGLCRGRVRRGRDLEQGEEHEAWPTRASSSPAVARSGCSSPRNCQRTGTPRPTHA